MNQTGAPSSRSNCYLGIDLGTSGLKLTVVAADGEVLAESEEPYEVSVPHPGYAETDPADWLAAFHRALDRLPDLAAPLAAAGVTGQMHGVVLAGSDGQPVRPAVLWPDQRAAEVLAQWQELAPEARARLSNPIVAGMSGPVLSWLGARERDSLDAATLVTFPKDWVRGQLTGDSAGERSDASASLLWDVVADDWSAEALSLAGVAADRLPEVVASHAVVGKAQLLGAPVPVVAGAADAASALLALKTTQPEQLWAESLAINVGTGIQLLRPETTATARAQTPTHLYADADGGWYEMLAIQNGGIALSWVQKVLGQSWDAFVASAKASPAGSKGAVFLPFLSGERGGIAPAEPNAGWSSLSTAVGPAELARSAFESLTFTIRLGVEILGGTQEQVLLSGGGARDPWVRQLIADVLHQPVRYVQLRSASSVGAAVLAARGVGVSLPVPATMVEVTPDSGDAAALDAAYERWRELVRSA
jgi:xylulokinase